MKKYLWISLFALLLSSKVQAQAAEEGQIMILAGMDAYKTDYSEAFKKTQIGLEMNFFIADKFSVGAGFEMYTPSNIKYISALNPRFYPVGGLFLRAKPLIPLNKQKFDVPVGAGYDFMISDTWAIEIVGDYYPIQEQIAARFGFGAFF